MVKRGMYLVLFIILLSAIVVSHNEVEEKNIVDLNLNYVYLGLLLIIILSFFAIFFRRHLRAIHKKIFFYAIGFITIAVTLYLLGITIYWNVVSESNGPVHWHADIEILMNIETSDPGINLDAGTRCCTGH